MFQRRMTCILGRRSDVELGLTFPDVKNEVIKDEVR
jgi:hypothetical protein